MKDITTIVIPVDLEEHTETIVEYGARLAEKLSAVAYVISVVEPFEPYGDMEMGSYSIRDFNDNRMKHSTEAMNKVLKKFPGITGEVLSGQIVDEIVTYADTNDAQLIILGTHGSQGIEKLLLGSVAERVVKASHCPTLVINPYKQRV
jgi:nucleotide-binding universal stress UspA family protein